VADFAGLESAITAATIEALRDGGGKLDPGINSAMEERLAERERARTEATAAQEAMTTLLAERAAASDAVRDAGRAVDVAVAHVLGIHADALAQECRELQAQIESRRRSLLAFDRIATSLKVPLSFVIQHVLRDGVGLGAPDMEPWTRAGVRLVADPMAEMVVELPVAVIPPLASPLYSYGPPVDAVAAGISKNYVPPGVPPPEPPEPQETTA
jgi:hypothetical protein